MVKRKIIWSHKAKIKLFQILEFYTERNKSIAYTKKLYTTFNKELSVLLKQPEIGIKTDIESVRGLIVDEFILFYEIISDKVVVHTVWDCRQNPDNLLIKK
jgi:plasmid stabilization system protein ParE